MKTQEQTKVKVIDYTEKMYVLAECKPKSPINHNLLHKKAIYIHIFVLSKGLSFTYRTKTSSTRKKNKIPEKEWVFKMRQLKKLT